MGLVGGSWLGNELFKVNARVRIVENDEHKEDLEVRLV